MSQHYSWNEVLENEINKQINRELQAGVEYYNMSLYFDRQDVAIDNLSNYFKKMSDEEKEHADMFCRYLNKRGGKVILEDIPAPSPFVDTSEESERNDIIDSFTKSLQLEKKIDSSLKTLYSLAEDMKDTNLCNFLDPFLEEQINSINDLNKQITQISRMKNNPFGLWFFASHIKSTHN